MADRALLLRAARAPLVSLAGPPLLAAAVVLPTLGRQPLSWDEAVTRGAASRSVPVLGQLLHRTDAPLGLYYLLMHGWLDVVRALGAAPTEGWLRFPSAVGAVLVVAFTVLVARELIGPSAALATGLLLAVHPLLTFYAQDARPYTLAAAAVAAATLVLLRALERPTVIRVVGYALLAVLACYLHLFAVLALLAHAVLVVRRGGDRRWVWVAVAIAAAVSPLVLVAARQTGEIGWIPRPSVASVLSVSTHIQGGIALTVVLGLLGVVAVRRRSPGTSGRTVLFVAAWTLLPLLLLVLADFATPVLVARYALVAVPGSAIVAGMWVRRVGGRAAVALGAVVVLVAAVTTGVQLARPYKYENYRAAVDEVGDHSVRGDGVLFSPASARAGFDVYVGTEPELSGLRDAALRPDGQPARSDHIGGVELPPSQLRHAVGDLHRVFVVGDPATSGPDYTAKLRALSGFRLVWTRSYGAVDVRLFDR